MSDVPPPTGLAEEIAAAFEHYQARGEEIRATGAWPAFAELFTEDAEYDEHAFGTFHGRDEIRDWVVPTMTTFPGRVMTGFPMAWSVIDAPTRRVICEVRNLMPEIDGQVLEASNLTILTYGHDGLWAREEDVYNPMRFARLATDWAVLAERAGVLPDDARSFLPRS